MENKFLSILLLSALFLGIVSCNLEQTPPNESSDAPPEYESDLPIPKSTQPTEDISILDNSSTTIKAGLWRFESEPEVVDGKRIYLAYVWFAAKNDLVILTRSSTAGIASQDFGLCDQRWKGDNSPFLETKQGSRYLPGIIGCEYAFFTDPLLLLYPDIPVAGKGNYFFYWFQIPYKEEPLVLALPGIGSTINLPDITNGPFSTELPKVKNAQTQDFGKIVKVNDTFEVNVMEINLMDLNDKNYLAVVSVKVINHDPNSSFRFAIGRSLLDDHGFYWEPAEAFGYYQLVDSSLCPNRNSGLDETRVQIPANGEVETRFCFVVSKELATKFNENALPSEMIFIMMFDDAVLAFKGKPTYP